VFSDGQKAFDYLCNANDIDLIIMDVLLPFLDGLLLIKKLLANDIKKKIIITSTYKDERLIRDLSKYGISGYFIKPFSYESLENIVLSLDNERVLGKGNVDLMISELLHNLGIPSHIRGYKYIREGITIIYNSPTIILVTKEIYPTIACKYETTPSRVERAIRHAIEVSWIRGDLNLMEELFGFSVSCDKAKPTNSEFLSTIADRLKLMNANTA
jgi:two-component system response regulator (stage 0 sporulation protein A)